MKIGLVGYKGSGKSTLFEWLTGVKPDPATGRTVPDGHGHDSRAPRRGPGRDLPPEED